MASSSTCARFGGQGCRSRSSCTHSRTGSTASAPATDELIASAVPAGSGRRRRRAAARAARARARRARVVASAAGPAREPDRRGGDAGARKSKSTRWRAGGDVGACGARAGRDRRRARGVDARPRSRCGRGTCGMSASRPSSSGTSRRSGARLGTTRSAGAGGGRSQARPRPARRQASRGGQSCGGQGSPCGTQGPPARSILALDARGLTTRKELRAG